MEIRPKKTDKKDEWPIGFHLRDDIQDKRYVDGNGEPLTTDKLDAALKAEGSGVHKVTVSVRYRLPSDPINRYRKRDIVVHVVGELTSESLSRVVAAANRTLYGKNPEVLVGRTPVEEINRPEKKRKRSGSRPKPGRET